MISKQAWHAQGTRAKTWPKAAPLLSEACLSAATPIAAVPRKYKIKILPQRVCCSQNSARLAQHMRTPKQSQKATPPIKNHVTSKSPVGDISVVTLIRTDTTLDHSQKAEKVCLQPVAAMAQSALQHHLVLLSPPAVLASHSHRVPSLPAAHRKALCGQQSQAHCVTSGMKHWQLR